VQPGSTCTVFGCGLVGLGAVIGCRLAGADRIIAIDLSEERLGEARRHGAADTRLAAKDSVEWIRSQTGGFGADYTFEATGNVDVMARRSRPRAKPGARDGDRGRWQGRDARHRPQAAHHGQAGDGLSFGGAGGARS
jgi:S-(hydroxymethyl)glutathione dehydrogenase/alcohol dehydrogenase